MMNLFAWLNKKKCLLEIKSEELYNAQRRLLEAQSGLEYARSQVDYNTSVVNRLLRDIQQETNKLENEKNGDIVMGRM